jgi:methylenetetrahydrofolate dehydrogenase (NADP+)/methenyltetrahydrofolate cyclohydrolase
MVTATAPAQNKILDGKILANQIKEHLKASVKQVTEVLGIAPGLAVVLLGENPASKVYVSNKEKACAEIGVRSFPYNLPEDTSQEYLIELLQNLNHNHAVHGMLVQLPLPAHISPEVITETILPEKDVDGFHPLNLGKLLAGQPCLFTPPTPAAVMKLLDQTGVPLDGLNAVVVGRSTIVGKPVALLLLQRNLTVTLCHSRTRNLGKVIKNADVVVAAIGKPKLIGKDMIKPSAIVIDVGINRTFEGKLVGDVDFETVEPIAKFITPVPGGVGPMTIAMLLKNTVEAAMRRMPEFY